MKHRVTLAIVLMVTGPLLVICGILSMVLASLHEPGATHVEVALALLGGRVSPDFWVPVCSHLGVGVALVLLGDRWRRKLKKDLAAQVKERLETAACYLLLILLSGGFGVQIAFNLTS